ncbi:MAG: PD-(D/E)XK nuclease family transposase [Desulfovibrionaceae bacterium]|nr:PD-(D/E)XK nuclease family transposase [Desulfovibrionaceae bacterium]
MSKKFDDWLDKFHYAKFNSNKIIDFTFQDQEFSSESYSAKPYILEVLGKTDSNANINIAVQVKALNDYDKLDLFYWAKIFSSDLLAY